MSTVTWGWKDRFAGRSSTPVQHARYSACDRLPRVDGEETHGRRSQKVSTGPSRRVIGRGRDAAAWHDGHGVGDLVFAQVDRRDDRDVRIDPPQLAVTEGPAQRIDLDRHRRGDQQGGDGEAASRRHVPRSGTVTLRSCSVSWRLAARRPGGLEADVGPAQRGLGLGVVLVAHG